MSTRKPPRWTKPANHRGILVFDSRNNLEQVKPSTSSKNIAHIESQLRELTAYSDNGDAAEPGTRLNPHYIGDMAPNADSKSLHGDIGQPDRLSKNDLCVVCDFSPVFQERQRQKASLLAKTEYNFGAATIDRDRLWELSKKSANPSMLESLKSDVHKIFWSITNINLHTRNDTGTSQQKLEHEFVLFLTADRYHEGGHTIQTPCTLYLAQRQIWAALLADWRVLSPQVFGSQARLALQVLANVNIQLSDHDWAISWVDFLHSADTAMLGCLIQKLSEAKGVIDHLMIRAEGLGIDWLYCLYGVDDYRRKLQNEIDRRTVLSKPSTTARPGEGYFEQTYITPGDRAGQQPQNESRAMEGSHPSGGGVSAISQQPAASIHVLPDRQGRGPSSTPGRVHETTSIPVNNRDDAREDAEAMHQHRNEEIDQLSEEWTHLLAGWCRLGQQGESNVWIKVFCILYALASVGIEPSEAASGI